MRTIHISASSEYDVIIGSGILSTAGEKIRALTGASSALIVSDDNVYPLYGNQLEQSLQESGFRTDRFVFPHGEANKNVETWKNLLEYCCAVRLTRNDVMIALGGGVVGDLTGFAAATYQRGIRYIQIPTTLLAMVDSSVGGKTAVDLAGGKNMAGCFHQPALVLCDPDALSTLPEIEYRCGCAEIIKYAMIGSEDLFRSLSAIPVSQQFEPVISACVEMKRRFVSEDEYDTGLRMMLNFGHTFGHAVEACSGFTVLHGQGVATGMSIMARAACEKKILPPSNRDALLNLIRLYRLPTETSYPAKDLASAAGMDKKSIGGSVRVIIPERIGSCRIETVPSGELLSLLRLGGVR